MKAYLFPGQGAQFVGMGKDLYDNHSLAKELFEEANAILGFRITDQMFAGEEADLKQTRVTQPAIFLHSVILAKVMGNNFQPDMVAGHSLGEFSALVANGALSFAEGLTLVSKRAMAMQKACEAQPSTMAAILMADDEMVEKVCSEIDDIVVPANYNCPGQLVISGTFTGIDKAIARFAELGIRRAMKLNVGGAFHSPLMEPAKLELSEAINNARFSKPVCPVYQNVTGLPETDPARIRENLVAQLTSPVRWTQTISNMINDGATIFIELGPGKVLQGLVKKLNKDIPAESGTLSD
ncbi:MAG: ACP S-malonyltransferase [Bacteroidia bacterium]|nr:ACP S-malonyltransferase [Bacteroidia bacterium]